MSPATEMNRFLMDVENRAFRMAELAVGNRDDAMDIVQDTMLTLARKYAKRPTTEWRPLFFRILQNRITDCYRRRASSNRLFSFFSSFRNDEGEVVDVAALQPGPAANEPEQRTVIDGASDEVDRALAKLPPRQRQAFLLRSWEGLSVAETAAAMNCSEGSVKTHYSRAVGRLREALGAHWP